MFQLEVVKVISFYIKFIGEARVVSLVVNNFQSGP